MFYRRVSVCRWAFLHCLLRIRSNSRSHLFFLKQAEDGRPCLPCNHLLSVSDGCVLRAACVRASSPAHAVNACRQPTGSGTASECGLIARYFNEVSVLKICFKREGTAVPF